MRRSTLRPSNTDKLDPENGGCEWFVSDKGRDMTFLNRGSDMDSAYRDLLKNFSNIPESYKKLTEDEKSRVAWVVTETYDISGDNEIISDKSQCMVVIPGFRNPGEVDAECPGQLCSFDVKSGQEYRYYNQQGCYAYGEMLKHFSTSWTVWVLYMDLRKRVKYSYTFDVARQLVERLVNSYSSPQEPKICQFCDWCGNFEICPAQRELVDKAMGHMKPEFSFDGIKDDPVKLAEFLNIMHPIAKDGGWYKRAKSAALEFAAKDKDSVPGWTMVSRQGDQYVLVEDIYNIPTNEIVKAYQKMPASVYRDLCNKHGTTANEIIIKQSPGYSFLQQSRKKNN